MPPSEVYPAVSRYLIQTFPTPVFRTPRRLLRASDQRSSSCRGSSATTTCTRRSGRPSPRWRTSSSPTSAGRRRWRRWPARCWTPAPQRFALAGLSLGGYVVLEVLRQARSRVTRVALLDTSARPESPEQTARRPALLDVVDDHGLDAGLEALWPTEVAASRVADAALARPLPRDVPPQRA